MSSERDSTDKPPRLESAEPETAGESPAGAAAPEATPPWFGWGELAVLLASVGSLVIPIGAAGLWDPHELDVVEQSRRIGATIFGAESLIVEGANNDVPTLEELGRGQLPFTLMALGLKLFGLSDWGARLPLALCALIGVLATYWAVRRLTSRHAAVCASLILATTPLYFVHARSALGEIVTMSAMALAFGGLAVAVFDERLRTGGRWLAWLVASLGLVAGFTTRGFPIGVAVPALGVGIGWYLTRPPARQRVLLAEGFGGVSLGIGAVAAALSCWAFARLPDGGYSMWIGSAVDPVRELPTHDLFAQQLAYGLFPYSALLPGAIAVVLLRARTLQRADLGLRTSLLAGGVLACGAYALMAPSSGALPFGAPVLAAALVGLLWTDLRGVEDASGSDESPIGVERRWLPALGLGSAALLVLLALDFREHPDKVLSVFSVGGTKLPSGLTLHKYFFAYSGLIAAVLFFGALYDFATPRRRLRFRGWLRLDDQLTWFRFLRRGYSERMFYSLLTAVLAAAGLLAVRGVAWLKPEWVGKLSRVEVVMFFGEWGLPLIVGLVLAPSVVMLARDIARLVFDALPFRRSTIAGLVLLGVAGAVSIGYYPALAAELSPRSAFQAFRNHSAAGEPLGMIGGQAVSARYYAAAEVKNLSSVNRALSWLFESETERRWLVLKDKDLARLNAKFRELEAKAGRPLANLPIIDADSSEVFLATSSLPEGQSNRNPLSKWLPVTRPSPARSVDVNFAGQLECLGWEITDGAGQPVDRVKRERDYELTFYYEVKAPVTGKWMTFIHIDGEGKRINGDHETLHGEYPFSLWRPGDFIADRYKLNVKRSYPAGNYTVYFGFFSGDTRLSVSRGSHKEDRVRAGTFRLY